MTDIQSGFQVLSSNNPDLRIRDYKKQRPHKKSRSGCLPCKVKKVKVCVFSRLSIPAYCYLYDISVTSVNLFANDVKETKGHVYIAGLMTMSTNTIMLTALRFQTSAQSP
jgi:hypothetical protein